MKWTEEKVLKVIAEARERGKSYADRKLLSLRKQGPAFAVTEEDGTVIDTMLDCCGFATLRIPARGKFYQLCKKLSGQDHGFNCGKHYYGGGGLTIFDSTFRQEMSVNVAACRGQAEVLAQYEVKASVESRID